jgi:hypothetical protein
MRSYSSLPTAAWLTAVHLVAACGAPGAPPPAPAARATPAAHAAAPPAPPAPPEQPAAVPSVPAVDWKTRLDVFYAAYGEGSAGRRREYEKLFAEQLTRFITRTNLSRSAAIAAGNAFFRDKTEIRYRRASMPAVTNQATETRIELDVDMAWLAPVPAAWEDTLPLDEWLERGVRHEIRARVSLTANAAGRVTAYDEKPAQRHFRVTEQGGGRPAFELPRSETEPGYQAGAAVRLKAGAIVEDANRYVWLRMDGPSPEQVREIVLGGKRYFTREFALHKVDNPHGGTSVGGATYLERTD